MNSRDDVELRLRAWMQDAAPSREPASLAARVASGTERTRQRPAILVRSGLRERRFALPALSPEARWLLLAVLLLAVVAGAIAVGSRVFRVLPVEPPPRLVYTLDGDIYAADEDGSEPIRIVDGDPAAECGGVVGNAGLVSPDGRHLAYRSAWDDHCVGTIFIADRDGRLISAVPGVGWDVAWAPDGTRFATWLELGSTIAVYALDGTREATLDGSLACCGDYDPAWSADGSSLIVPAWAAASGEPLAAGAPLDTTARPGVLELPLDGGEPRTVPAGQPEAQRSASHSPDGTRVVFDVAGPWPWERSVDTPSADARRARLVMVTADDGTRMQEVEFAPGEQVDDGWRRGPVWSPAGDLLAVIVRRYSAEPDGDLIQESADLRVVDAASGRATTVAGVEDDAELRPIAFSADGKRILVLGADADGNPSLSAVNVDGSGSTVLVSGADAGAWLPPPVDADDPVPQ